MQGTRRGQRGSERSREKNGCAKRESGIATTHKYCLPNQTEMLPGAGSQRKCGSQIHQSYFFLGKTKRFRLMSVFPLRKKIGHK